MTTSTVDDTRTVDQLLEKVKEISPIIREHSAEADQERTLSRPVVDAMVDAGLFRLARPKALGGLELDPVSTFRVIEEVSRHDCSAGWNLCLSNGAESLLAWLPDAGAEEIGRTPDLTLAGVFFPGGTAVPVEGGYRVSGQWSFLSGCQHAKWMLVVSLLMNGDQPELDEQGNPKQLFSWFPAGSTTILDTWHTLGMHGTGSHDVKLDELFVPTHHTAALLPLSAACTAFQGPLYRLTVWTPVALLAPPALGIARAAIDGFVELARGKTPSYTGSTLRDRQVVQRQVAEAEAHLSAGRAFLFEVFEDAWQAAVDAQPIDLDRKLRMQLATSHAIACAAKAVDLIHAAAGTSAIRNHLAFQRHFRDVHTITQHAFGSAQRYESVGALILGVESDWGFFPF